MKDLLSAMMEAAQRKSVGCNQDPRIFLSLFLLGSASFVAYHSIHLEVVSGEPALRGLVHAGLGAFFACTLWTGMAISFHFAAYGTILLSYCMHAEGYAFSFSEDALLHILVTRISLALYCVYAVVQTDIRPSASGLVFLLGSIQTLSVTSFFVGGREEDERVRDEEVYEVFASVFHRAFIASLSCDELSRSSHVLFVVSALTLSACSFFSEPELADGLHIASTFLLAALLRIASGSPSEVASIATRVRRLPPLLHACHRPPPSPPAAPLPSSSASLPAGSSSTPVPALLPSSSTLVCLGRSLRLVCFASVLSYGAVLSADAFHGVSLDDCVISHTRLVHVAAVVAAMLTFSTLSYRLFPVPSALTLCAASASEFVICELRRRHGMGSGYDAAGGEVDPFQNQLLTARYTLSFAVVITFLLSSYLLTPPYFRSRSRRPLSHPTLSAGEDPEEWFSDDMDRIGLREDGFPTPSPSSPPSSSSGLPLNVRHDDPFDAVALRVYVLTRSVYAARVSSQLHFERGMWVVFHSIVATAGFSGLALAWRRNTPHWISIVFLCFELASCALFPCETAWRWCLGGTALLLLLRVVSFKPIADAWW